MDSSRLFFATSGPAKHRTHYFCLLFSQYCVCYFLNLVSNPNLPTSPKHQFREYHAWNRIEKLMPQHCTNFLKLLKLYEKRPTCFQTLTFCRNLGFQKPWICPWISYGFPPPRFFGEAAGAADKKCGEVWGGRELFSWLWGESACGYQ